MYWPPRLLSRCAHLAAVLWNEYSCHVAESKQTDRCLHWWQKIKTKNVPTLYSATYSSQIPDAQEASLPTNHKAGTFVGQAHWANVVFSRLQTENGHNKKWLFSDGVKSFQFLMIYKVQNYSVIQNADIRKKCNLMLKWAHLQMVYRHFIINTCQFNFSPGHKALNPNLSICSNVWQFGTIILTLEDRKW